MLIVFFPLVLSLFFPYFSSQYQKIKELNFLEMELKSQESCPESLRDYFESLDKARCLPPLSDHAQVGKSGAQDLVNFFLEA